MQSRRASVSQRLRARAQSTRVVAWAPLSWSRTFVDGVQYVLGAVLKWVAQFLLWSGQLASRAALRYSVRSGRQ